MNGVQTNLNQLHGLIVHEEVPSDYVFQGFLNPNQVDEYTRPIFAGTGTSNDCSNRDHKVGILVGGNRRLSISLKGGFPSGRIRLDTSANFFQHGRYGLSGWQNDDPIRGSVL